MMFGVWGLGFRVRGSGFRVQGSGLRVQGLTPAGHVWRSLLLIERHTSLVSFAIDRGVSLICFRGYDSEVRVQKQ